MILHPTTKKKHNEYQNFGFSLVELSIVIAIIGLLAGGILTGKHLIRSAELRNIATEKELIQTAVHAFIEKYQALPGDIPNATSFWGVMPTGTCSISWGGGASGGTGTQTCNGNGDGIISLVPTVGNNAEGALFWQHLAHSGFIQGQYTGIFSGWGASGSFYFSKLGDRSYYVPHEYLAFYPQGILPITDTVSFEGDYGHTLVLMSNNANNDVVTPSEAWSIDKKVDDGLPGVGMLVTRERDGANCNTLPASTTTPAANFTYNLANNSIACELEFKNMW